METLTAEFLRKEMLTGVADLPENRRISEENQKNFDSWIINIIGVLRNNLLVAARNGEIKYQSPPLVLKYCLNCPSKEILVADFSFYVLQHLRKRSGETYHTCEEINQEIRAACKIGEDISIKIKIGSEINGLSWTVECSGWGSRI